MAGSDNSKAFAVLLAFLMATISFSASISSWEFSTLDEKSTVQNVSSNSTVEIVNNIPSIIETGILGNINSGTYEQINSDSGMHFLAENISDENKLASGNQHICAITNEVSVLCWGDNTHNQLGVSDSSLRRNIVDLGVGRTAIAVAAGISHTCAILDNGSLKCWGSTAAGQTNGILNGDTTPSLVDLGVGRTAVSVSIGGYHTCAILDDGSLKCWGSNNYGQLGLGSTSAYSSPQSVFLGVGRTAVSVSLGWYHTCAILDDGSLKCWGQNSQGQLGIGTTLDSSIPQLVNLGTTPLSVSLGMWHTCATTNNNVMCWGNNNRGQLGTNSQTASSTPQVVNFVAVSLSLGREHTCGISSVGIVKCWGSNDHGQIGFIGGDPNQIEDYYDSPKTAYFSEDNIAIKISAGNDFNCAVSQNNTIRCWGLNNAGQLGFLSYGNTKSHYPELFGDKINVKAKHIFAEIRANCVISDFSELYCWGSNPLGLLGLNSFGFQNIRKPTKANMPNDLGVMDIGLAEDHVCALLEDSNVYCWGNSDYGQIPGSGGYTIFPTMVNLGSGVNSETIAAAGRYSCSLMDNGEIKCWGDNVNGQLGIGSVGGEHLPTTVNLGSNAEFISTSSGHACAILTNGGVKCWGSNSAGQLGAGTSGGRTGNPTLVNLPSGRSAESIFLGSSSSCAILDNGSLYCWGANSFGQLGIGSTTSHNTPQYVDFGNNVAVQSVAISTYHACAILVNGSTYCWGSNTEGQLGLGNTLSFQTPQFVDLEIDEKAVSIGVGFQHTCVVLESGLMKCWGNGAQGVLGTGGFTSYNIPQETIGIEYTHPIKAVPNINNSWVGSVKSDGNYNLQVWYNSSSSSTYHNTILSVIPQLEYQSNNFSFTVNQTLQNISPVSVNGDNYFFTISPNLPTGLLFNQSTAVISGTPSEVIPEIQYLIRGFNQDGIGETKLSIEITDIIPDFSIDNNNLNFIRGFKDETFNVNNLGGAITISSLEPQISGLSSMNSLYSNSLIFNEASNCAILSSNLTCWNTDLISQSANSFLTVNHENLITDLSISSTNICAINSENQAICLGENGFGQIDSSLTSYSNLTDLDIDQVYAEKQIAAISNQICVLNLLGEINCQGLVNSSKLGSNLGPFSNLDSGRSHFCASNYIGKLYCWGDNSDSAIAPGQSASSGFLTELNPIILGVGVTVSSFDTGQKHNCVIRNDGKIMCWGTGTNGQLGNGYSVTDSTPSLVASPAWATYTKVSAGNSHTCAMLDDNGVMCWGDNSKGQLGDGTTTNRLIPVNVSIIPSWMNVVDVVAGDSGTCVIDDLAAVWCWGDNSNQKLGLNSTINTATTPQPIRFSDSASLMGVLPMGVLTGAPLTSQPATVHRLYGNNSGGSDDVNITITVGLAADYPISHLNLTRNTSVVNLSPVLTGGPYQFSIHPSLPPGMNLGINNGTIWGTPLDDQVSTIHTITVENNSGWDKVEINITVSDILANISYPSSDYTFVRNWTIDPIYISNTDGGDLLSVNSNIDLPIGLELNTSFITYDSAIASESGGSHSCSILDDGSLKCWGYNDKGQLGIGTTSSAWSAPPVTTPQLVDLGVGRTAVSLGLGFYHTCAILDDGSLKCWGYNGFGQLGNGTIIDSNTPVAVSLPAGRTVVSVSLGHSHTCAILDDGSLKCWGRGGYGQLGIGSLQNQETPQLVDLGVGRTAVSVSLGQYHTCAILDDGSLKCWGYNFRGQIGIGTSGSSTNQLTPQLVDLGVGRTAVSVSLGNSHTCAILDDGSLKCWGWNINGRLGIGNGSTTLQTTPQLVDLGVGRTAVSVSLGSYHTCAILDDGNLKCWGLNSGGQLGIGSIIDQTTPAFVEGFGLSIKLGKIYGTPIQTTPTQTYTFYGNNSVGSDTFDMNITVVPAYDYGNNTLVLTRNESMTARSPIITGGPYTVAISPLLPQGLNFEPSNGTIWGTPPVNQTTQTYFIDVSNSSGSDTIELTITIDDIAPYVTYDTYNETFVRGFNITTIEANQTGGNVHSVQVNPALPQGIEFSNDANQVGFISGIPLIKSEWTDYTIWTNNSVGSHSSIISMRVVPAYDYGNNTLNLVRNETMSTRSPIITGGPYTTVSIQPSLPVGLFFEPTNGSIWGTPIFDQAGTDYTITVSNQYGSDSSIISIAISEIPPILEYDVSYMSYRRGFLSEHPVANLTGGAVAGFEISPSLPAGLHFNISSGIISGIPTTTHSLTTHTIWANNSFGSSSWDINFEVLPGIDNSYNSIYLTRNVTMPAYSPTININQITLSIQPPLPDGLSFDYQTAVISGTPLIPWTNTFYSIRLSNSTGEDWLNFTLEVEEILPNIYYPSSNLNLFNGYGFEPLRPIGDAGYPETWAWNGSSVVGIHLSKYNSTDTISSSGSTICTITADYRVVCWGANGMGQLGQGNTNSISNLVNVTLTSIHSPVDIAVGKYHTCVVNSAGEIECWGQNDFGQLGRGFSCAYGSYSNGCNGNFAVSSPGKVSYSGEFGFVEVSVGDTHTCGLLENGTAMCWGSNSDGQLGDGTNLDSSIPVYVSLAQSIYFTQMDLGKAHSCATNYSGEIYCWGRNSFGQLGDGTIQNRLIPTLVNLPIGYSAISVSSGGDHSCAILNGSQPACWGRNSQGQLGDGTLLGKLEPRIIVNSAWSGTSRIIAGEGQSCVITLDHEVWCWGQSSAGMFSSTNSILTSPVKVENTNSIGASLVVVGENHICISTIRWSVMCSGDNQENQIPWNNASMVSELNEYRGLMIHVDRSIAGTIYGAPENGLGSVTLEMAITNDIGTQYVQNTIIISDSFSYPLSFIESIRNQSLSPVTPSLSGLTNARFTIEPNLPAGLNIDSLTGEISGMPTVNSTENTYVITYASVYGEVSTSISLVIYEPAADIVYPVSDIIITRAGQFIQYAPTVSNGFVSHWSISPSLPSGLSFNNGLISGQALNNQTNTTYRVYGNNSGGVSFVDLTITILEPVPEFTPLQTEYVIQRGDTLADIIVGNTGGNVALWTISPQLPNGLVFTNGRISGIPIENMSSITYTIRGENTGGFDEVIFTIQVLEPAPVIQGQYSSITAIRDSQIDEIIISNSGGMAENWTIIPDLPEGLIFENGYIYGTPSVNSTSELFTITAVSEGGSSQWSFNLEVLEPSPEFSLSGFDYILYKDEPFEAIKTTSSGGNIASYSITPTLPSGMFFDENRGIIQGVPLIISPEIQYTITAQNSGGTYQQTISIMILNQAPIFTLPYESISLTEQVEMAKFAPFISSNIVVDTWSLEFEQGNQLPQGLVFDSTSGSIFGKPTSVVPEINITINASNDGGFYSLSFKMKVLSDYDGDTIPDELDEDDDNDGYSDNEEELKNSDPYDEDSNPVEGFEIIIPNTEISLGAWDIIGMLTGIPLIIFLTFSLLTRNKRMRRFQDSLEMAKSREEISEIAERYEKALMLRLIGPHHGMRLERIRAETDDKLEEAERRFRYKMEEQQQQFEEKVEVEKAQFFDEVDQTPLVEQSEELAVEQSEEAGLGPQIDTEPTQTDEQGRQWYYDEEQRYWWRDSSEEEWQLLDNDSTESKNREEELKQNKF